MNKRNAIALLVAVAVAGTAAASQAAQKTTPAERAAAAAAIAKNKDAAIERQPKTMAQADQTQSRTKSGGIAVRVPTELWSTLASHQDANSTVHVTETDGQAPSTHVEGLPNE